MANLRLSTQLMMLNYPNLSFCFVRSLVRSFVHLSLSVSLFFHIHSHKMSFIQSARPPPANLSLIRLNNSSRKQRNGRPAAKVTTACSKTITVIPCLFTYQGNDAYHCILSYKLLSLFGSRSQYHLTASKQRL